nr:FtsX-like permease family protein [Ardenticatenaceae bacterium]
SVSSELLEAYPFEVGDVIEFSIQGVPLEAEVTSLREIDQEEASFTPRFSFVFREADLVSAPQTILTTVNVAPEEVAGLQNRLVGAFPNLTVVDVSAAIDTLAELVGNITIIIRFFTLFSIVAGVLIIISSVLATRFARIQESVYFKVLGAKRQFVLKVFTLENVFIGFASALIALFLSQLAGYLLVTQVFELDYRPYWVPSVLLMAFSVGLVTTVGLLASISILNKKPITFLRDNTVE